MNEVVKCEICQRRLLARSPFVFIENSAGFDGSGTCMVDQPTATGDLCTDCSVLAYDLGKTLDSLFKAAPTHAKRRLVTEHFKHICVVLERQYGKTKRVINIQRRERDKVGAEFVKAMTGLKPAA